MKNVIFPSLSVRAEEGAVIPTYNVYRHGEKIGYATLKYEDYFTVAPGTVAPGIITAFIPALFELIDPSLYCWWTADPENSPVFLGRAGSMKKAIKLFREVSKDV